MLHVFPLIFALETQACGATSNLDFAPAGLSRNGSASGSSGRPGSTSDLVRVSLDEVHLDDSDPRIVRTRAKTGAPIVARVSLSTADLVRRYLDDGRPKSYLFESRPGKHYRRQWPYEVLRRHGVPRDITPRTFRRTLATVWPGDLKTLQHQGGWKDPKTILTHYVQQRNDVHRQTVDVLFGNRDEVADDLAYGTPHAWDLRSPIFCPPLGIGGATVSGLMTAVSPLLSISGTLLTTCR